MASGPGNTAGRSILLNENEKYLELFVGTEQMPRLEITPEGIFTGDGVGDTSVLTTSATLSVEEDDIATAVTIDFDGPSRLFLTLNDDTAVTFDNVPSGTTGKSLRVYYIQDVTGGHVVTHTDEIAWQGYPPVIEPTPGAITVVEYDGGTGIIIGYGPQQDPDSVTAGIENIPRRIALAGNQAGTGNLRLSYFTAPRSATINAINAICGPTAAASLTYGALGIYEVTNVATGALGDRLAITAEDLTTWAQQTAYSRPLAASVDLVAGTRYAIGCLFVGTTTPALLGIATQATGGNVMANEAPVWCKIVSGQATMNIDGSGFTLGGGNQYNRYVLVPV